MKEKPYFITVPPSALPKGQSVTNEESGPVSNINIQDIREENFSLLDLDKRGFSFARQDFSSFSGDDFADYRSLRMKYVPPMEDWIKKTLGADTIFTLSVTIRKRDVEFPKFTWGKSGNSQPIQGVHVGRHSQIYCREISTDILRLHAKARFRENRERARSGRISRHCVS